MPHAQLGPIPSILFFSRWLQLPLYFGLIVAQGVYVGYFMVELAHLVEAAVDRILPQPRPHHARTEEKDAH